MSFVESFFLFPFIIRDIESSYLEKGMYGYVYETVRVVE